MRLPNAARLNELGYSPAEKLFLSVWFSATHIRSLDSHRIRCANARILLKELCEELTRGRLSETEYEYLVAEAKELLEGDAIVKKSFSRELAVLAQYFGDVPKNKPAKDSKADERERIASFGFCLRDLSALLERYYFPALVEDLPQVIAGGREDEIISETMALLSDAVDRGLALSSLHSWSDYFAPRDGRRPPAFSEALAFMLGVLTRDRQEFEVTLRINGSRGVTGLGQVGSFQFIGRDQLRELGDIGRGFASHGFYKTFVKAKISALDFKTAASCGRETFDDYVDLIRFDYEKVPLRSDRNVLVERLGDRKKKEIKLSSATPSPYEQIELTEFEKFSRSLDHIASGANYDGNSKERLLSSIRQYRYGLDSDNHRDKFLNWWMGLEVLCSGVQAAGIGDSVSVSVSNTLALGYIRKLAVDLLDTCRGFRFAFDDVLRRQYGVDGFDDLKLESFVEKLKNEQVCSALATVVAPQPLLQQRLAQFCRSVQAPGEMRALVDRHRNHIRWHIMRLYRTRCTIVHGSSLYLGLELLAANLEYYLKELIGVVLFTLAENTHIYCIEDILRRAVYACNRLFDTLNVDPGHDVDYSVILRGSLLL